MRRPPAVFDYSAWDVVTDVAPQAAALWSFFEAALPVLEACATALEGVEAFAAVRTSAITFLASPTDAELAALRAAIVQAMPAYESWVAAFDLAADKVQQVAAYLAQVAQAFLAAAQELAAGSDFPFRDSLVDGLAFLGDLAVEWSDLVQAWADGIRHLADPVRGDLRVMADILDPPSSSGVDAPLLPFPWLLSAVAAALALARRRGHGRP